MKRERKRLKNKWSVALAAGTMAITAPFVLHVDEVAAQSTLTHTEVHVAGSTAYTSGVLSTADAGTVATMAELEESLLEAYESFTSTLTFEYTGAMDTFKVNFSDMQKALVTRPEHDYLHGTLHSYTYTVTGKKVKLDFKYFTTPQQEEKVDEKVAAIAAKIFKAGMSDVEKIMAVNDYIVTNTVFTTATKTSPYSAYAVLLEGKGNAHGYAAASLRLLQAGGLEARYIVGKGKNAAHAWNAVKVDGSWYYLDTAWNDPAFDGADRPGMVGYAYFLGNTAKFSEDHEWDKTMYPAALGAKYNHFHNAFGAVKVNNDLYYTDRNDNYHVYKMNYTTGTATKVLEKMAPYFAVYDEVIYYADYSAGGNKYLTSYDLASEMTAVLDKTASRNVYVDNYVLRYSAAGTAKTYELPLTETDAAIKAVYDEIAKLTETSPKADLEAARAKYAALAEASKEKVSNIERLIELEEKYETNKEAAEAVEVLFAPLTINSSYADLKAAFVAYGKLTAIQKELVEKGEQFEALETKYKEYTEALNKVLTAIKNIKSTNKDYIKNTIAARKAYDELVPELKELVTTFEQLTKAEEAIVVPKAVYDLIEGLNKDKLADVLAAREAYAELSAANKKYIVNLKSLTDAEKALKPTIAVVTAMKAIDPESAKFVAQVKAAVKAFEKTGVDKEALAAEAVILEDYSAQTAVIEQIAKLKLTNAKLIELAKEADTAYKALQKNNYVSNQQLLVDALKAIEPAEIVVEQIAKLENADVGAITAAREAYEALTKQEKKYVTNVKVLTAEEKRVKQVVTTIKAIEAIDPASTKFLAQIKTATNAYKKVNDKELVTNAHLLTEYEAQGKVYEQISKLKLTNAKLIEAAREAETAYKALANKNYITNVDMLTAALQAIEPAEAVVERISKLENASITQIMAAREAYDALSTQTKKYVTNVKILTAEEKRVKQAASLIKAIEAIDPNGKKFVSQVKSAVKAYDKISDKALITNSALLQEYEQQLPAYEKISKLKLTSGKLIAEARAAEAEYKKLTKTNYITNVDLLNDALKAIQPAEAVIGQIDALGDAPTVAAVQAARTAYNALTKQQQKYVTNIKKLTAAEKKTKQ